jgi:YbbR domain-containing protein
VPLQALDEKGEKVAGVVLQPAQVQVKTRVQGRSNTRDVTVRAVITGSLPSEYQVSGLSLAPSSVTLRADYAGQLAELGSYVNTLPINIDQATNDLKIETPLDLPAGVQILDDDGSPVGAVTVLVDIAPRTGAMSLVRPVELLAPPSRMTTTLALDPETVTLLLTGPQPILNEIENNPNLVRVAVDLSNLPQNGETSLLTPIISAPEEIEVEVIPGSIQALAQWVEGE